MPKIIFESPLIREKCMNEIRRASKLEDIREDNTDAQNNVFKIRRISSN